MTEKELRKKIRKEVRSTLTEENIITKVLGKILDGMSVASRKRALKKLKKSGFYQDLQQAAAESDAVKRNLDILNRL